jgi:hypothetical protein
MSSFNITRLHTEQGIFRLKGMQDDDQPLKITVLEIEMLGTDGWIMLDINNSKVLNFIDCLHDDIAQHLSPKKI